ncbi:MAG: hypothetical protein AB7F40_03385 [Victivallaceae bacterium]
MLKYSLSGHSHTRKAGSVFPPHHHPAIFRILDGFLLRDRTLHDGRMTLLSCGKTGPFRSAKRSKVMQANGFANLFFVNSWFLKINCLQFRRLRSIIELFSYGWGDLSISGRNAGMPGGGGEYEYTVVFPEKDIVF